MRTAAQRGRTSAPTFLRPASTRSRRPPGQPEPAASLIDLSRRKQRQRGHTMHHLARMHAWPLAPLWAPAACSHRHHRRATSIFTRSPHESRAEAPATTGNGDLRAAAVATSPNSRQLARSPPSRVQVLARGIGDGSATSIAIAVTSSVTCHLGRELQTTRPPHLFEATRYGRGTASGTFAFVGYATAKGRPSATPGVSHMRMASQLRVWPAADARVVVVGGPVESPWRLPEPRDGPGFNPSRRFGPSIHKS